MIDRNIAKKIVALAEVRSDETVLEVGPGRGSLTSLLCQAASKVVALEIDRALVDYLAAAFREVDNLEVKAVDALEFAYDQFVTPVVIVANLPYNISTPLLFRFFEARAHITRMTLMLQLEVAQRLIANPGTREYGALSVLAQHFTVPRFGFRIQPTCFFPRPDVTSAVVRLDMRHDTCGDPEETEWFMRTVRAAFQHRRKTLANALYEAGFPRAASLAALSAAGIAQNRRAETLLGEEFSALAQALRQHTGTVP